MLVEILFHDQPLPEKIVHNLLVYALTHYSYSFIGEENIEAHWYKQLNHALIVYAYHTNVYV